MATGRRARRQIAHELELIGRLDLAGYFLIVWDIVEHCRTHDILVQDAARRQQRGLLCARDHGGGSGRHGAPVRTVSQRSAREWPDIDLDLPSGERREAVIQHVYRRYGRLGAGMTANVITYRGRSAAREVGQALAFRVTCATGSRSSSPTGATRIPRSS